MFAIGVLAACGRGPLPDPIVVTATYTPTRPADGPAVGIRLLVQPEHRAQIDRYTTAALTALAVCGEWLGPFPRRSLTILDARPGVSTSSPGVDVVLDPAPWRDLPPAMVLELNVGRGIARTYWHDVAGSGGLPPWFVDGLAEFTARRIAVPLFENRALPGGYAVLEHRYFGGFLPWLTNIRMFPESDGDPLQAYRRHAAVDSAAVPRTPGDARVLTARTVMTLNTIERWVGRPTFDSAVAQFVRQYRGHVASIGDFGRTISAVSGQDLSWLFDEALASSRSFDYAVDRFESAPEREGFYRTEVVVRRLGDAVFTGTSAPPAGPFENGRGITVRVTFADGSSRVDTWDGRDPSRTFRYRSRARAASAEVDPERTIVLDVNQTNNSRALGSPDGVAATRWSARWLLWLQDFLLTYASLA